MRKISWILCVAFALHLAGWFLMIPLSAHAKETPPTSTSSCHQGMPAETRTPSTNSCLSHCLSQDYQAPSQTEGISLIFIHVPKIIFSWQERYPLPDPLPSLCDTIPPPIATFSHLTVQKRE